MKSDAAEDSSPANPCIDDLWKEFRSSRDEALREQLIEHYMPLARVVAGRLYRSRSERIIAFDDYLQYARVGLIESVDRYDVSREASFESYSSFRIRGSILNGLGHESEFAAQGRFWRTRASDRVESLASELPQQDDLAFDELIDLTMGIAIGFVLEERLSPVDDTVSSNPYAATEMDQIVRQLHAFVDELPARERDIVRSHYFEHLEFQVMAERMGVTKGRISQLHARAVARLREALEAGRKVDAKL